ncbi:MAG TPA: hypothetical protein VKM55_10250 [Candidatus Lokiarchaeia archaeon]|nr:hypothetical protein [Candidatus Lokiarchaeia archaeon]
MQSTGTISKKSRYEEMLATYARLKKLGENVVLVAGGISLI